MRKLGATVCGLIMLLGQITFAQSSFLSKQELVFSKAENQWMVTKLKEVNPSYFKCESYDEAWRLPNSSEFLLFGQTIEISEHEQVQFQQLLFPNGRCDRYLSLISLCDLYFPLFRKECLNTGLHDDFKMLPVLLSGCNQTAFTQDGKSGLWALDFLLARKQHLRIDNSVDERNGGDFTTKAAAQYLSELSTRYSDDAFKTAIAYIKGVPYTETLTTGISGGELLKTIDQESSYSLKFLAYFSKLINTTRVTNQLNQYFDIMAHYEAILPTSPVEIMALQKILEIPENELRSMNPVYTGSAIQPGYRKVPFLIERVKALKFEAFADSIYAWQPAPEVITPTVEFADEVIYYKVKKGDSLGKIASKYHVSIQQLKKWNGLKSDRISKGKKLKIIKTKRIEQPSKNHNAADTKDVSEKPTTKPPTNTPAQQALDSNKAIGDKQPANGENKKPAAKSTSGNSITYTVKSGDSLWTIAKKYPGITDKDIMKWNKCNEKIRPGQKLIIYPKGKK
jgi:membrane-bound lytic murein transglycosylase D